MSLPRTENWFGIKFSDFHPMLRKLHARGGVLRGDVTVTYGTGLAGVVARRLATKLGIPEAGVHDIRVEISHAADGLHWDRCFDGTSWMRSVFTPVGTIADGFWQENTGPLKLRLTVDIVDGGWHWRCLSVQFLGVPLPPWLFPKSTAYKTVENGRYRFHVGFSLPLLGGLLSYSGLLTAQHAE